MFKKPKQQPVQDIATKPLFLHKLITYGLILFVVYIYFTDFQAAEIKKREALENTRADDIKITNLITKQVVLVDPDQPKKLTVEVDKSTLPEGKSVIFEIEVPEPKPAP